MILILSANYGYTKGLGFEMYDFLISLGPELGVKVSPLEGNFKKGIHFEASDHGIDEKFVFKHDPILRTFVVFSRERSVNLTQELKTLTGLENNSNNEARIIEVLNRIERKIAQTFFPQLAQNTTLRTRGIASRASKTTALVGVLINYTVVLSVTNFSLHFYTNDTVIKFGGAMMLNAVLVYFYFKVIDYVKIHETKFERLIQSLTRKIEKFRFARNIQVRTNLYPRRTPLPSPQTIPYSYQQNPVIQCLRFL